RTFLPVRAIADIAGFDVDFDGAENMVILTTEGVGAVAVQPMHENAWNADDVYRVVWTANRISEVIHRTDTCSNMANPVQTTIGEALSRAGGGRPCQVCWAD
ncbi:MAG: copper amine oxidase N-terminal domain-containing protein, partial [Defluviitaleaceae bacterium]|nr:copper amine oxidase N-terminal domain-containing protein [Defluviitaleaceae bacterium]